ncbi:MAG TPA: hypothetical protein VKQ36_14500, partial [Ktedonobacterales bacterium]|nr:hypothetical protein [Ktedonobacterales bacterium]
LMRRDITGGVRKSVTYFPLKSQRPSLGEVLGIFWPTCAYAEAISCHIATFPDMMNGNEHLIDQWLFCWRIATYAVLPRFCFISVLFCVVVSTRRVRLFGALL